MSEQEQGNTEQGTVYSPEQFEEVRRARHAVRDALGRFHKVATIVGEPSRYDRENPLSEALRQTRRAVRAMQGRAGYTQEQQVERFDWAKEDVEAAQSALASVPAPENEFDAKVASLATEALEALVLPAIAEGRKIADERDFDAYKAAKDAYKARQYGGSVSHDEDDDVFDDED